ncbi:hypothetical protein DFH07DRAFT_884393 [Mycena maculata]|uniref:F-box domain-containing protein n=1 Tax=Mycena maculata TaxID=230809 RepID=A0AAD7J8T0_9AGAR|nr:hypothetical protein DFH07DRAFT_884393 [Mycena maculata]
MGSAGARPSRGRQLQSPFSSLLRTNTAPSDGECKAIRQFLSGLEGNLAALTDEIARMQSVQRDLTDQCPSLREAIDAHKALLSVSRQLPEDVVRVIFLDCLPAGNAVMTSREAPLLLAQVCTSWRRIAFSTPRLWSALHVVVPNTSRFRQMTGAVDAWLTRSGALPLSITLAVSRACEPGSDNIATMIDVLANFSTRWQRVKITLSPRTILTPLTNLQPSDVPMLESITFKAMGNDTWQNLVTAVDIPWRRFRFLQTPALRSASLGSLGGNILATPLPWPLLHTLSLTAGNLKDSDSFELTTSATLLILRLCSNLVSCTICITPQRTSLGDDADCPVIQLPWLTQLTIDNREYSQTNTISLFRPLLVPALKRLAYRGAKYEDNCPFVPLLSNIRALDSISVDVDDLTMKGFLHCVELLPCITQFRIEGGDAWSKAQRGRDTPLATANEILRFLTPALAGDCPAPTLRELRVDCCHPLADDVLLNFIQLRKEAGYPIRLVDVVFVRQMEFDVIPYLKEAVAEGLDISLKYAPTPVLPAYSPWEGLDDMA